MVDLIKHLTLLGLIVLVNLRLAKAIWPFVTLGEPDYLEIEHYGYHPWYYTYGPTTTTVSPWVDNTYKIPDTKLSSPDFRLPEPMPTPMQLSRPLSSYKQYNRPYRFSSSSYIAYYYGKSRLGSYFFKPDEADSFGCYCSTAYMRTIPLAGCAVLTTRHILTTASSTERVLKEHVHKETMEDILGVWYEMGYVNDMNASQYGTPARIHFHPWYNGLDKVNSSHPIPIYDLSVWALTAPTYSSGPYGDLRWNVPYSAIYCKRPTSHQFYLTSPGLRADEDYWVFGYQFIRAYNRKPNPYIKYGVRTKDIVYPCSKKEWGWFFCIGGRWAPLGVDSGAALHRSTLVHQRGWFEIPDMSGLKFWDTSGPKPTIRVDGLIGLAAFSLQLRSNKMIHYFTVTENHPVLDFLYSSYMGRLPYAFLDSRFYNTQWGAPYPKPWHGNYPSFTYPDPAKAYMPSPGGIL